MPVSPVFNPQDALRFLPEIILTVMGTLMMVLDPVIHKRSSHAFGHISIFALLAALGGSVYAYSIAGPAFGGMLMVDGFATFFRVLVIVVGILTVLPSYSFLARQEAETSEYHALLLFSIAGQCLMAASNDLIMVFLGLEISSIASYVLAGYLRDDKRSNESALKYFLLGSFATGFFLYGVALIYGATGSVNLSVVRAAILHQAADPTFVGVAAALIFVGLAFKVSAAPFQIWAPDVYQGAPTPVSAFLSAGPKAAAFAIFLRIFMTAFEPIGNKWQPLMWTVALASMCVGNFAALLQTNIKRMLAYSSIAHAGYVLVALTAQSETGIAAAMFYLAGYAFMNVGAFAAVSVLTGKGERYQSIDDFKGLGRKQPLAAALFTIFLLSLIGIPLTGGGFFGKFYVFKAALDSHLVWLSVLGLLNSAVAAYYYLRILVVMYMYEPGEAVDAAEPLSPSLGIALIVPALGTLVLGIFPNWVLEFATKSAAIMK